MELKRLRYFVAVAEELHFGRAAERLDMAQPPLSRQIAQLEKELQVKLFDRSRAQIRLTPAGDVLLDRSRQILDQLDSAFNEVTRIGQGSAGRLRIAFVGSASHGVLPTVIKSFRSHYPDVDLALSAMNNAELERALVQREIDIAVARPSLKGEDYRTVELHREPLVLAMPDNSALNTRSSIDLKDLAQRNVHLISAQATAKLCGSCSRCSQPRRRTRHSRPSSPKTIKRPSAWCRLASACPLSPKAFPQHKDPAFSTSRTRASIQEQL